MISEKLSKIINQKKTLLGVGPMSLNCVDASIQLANEYKIPLMLIASRRQVDSKKLGGGYVNNWTTKSFSKYVKKKDKKKNIILCRDHGGPWQNNMELSKKLNLKEAMKSSKKSYSEDIDNDFKIIHIDASVSAYEKKVSSQNILDRTFELYEYCYAYAKRKKKEIIFEVGTEEQSGSTNTFEEIEFFLNEITKFCKKNKLPNIFFIVLQSGTKVVELRNIGSFDSTVRVENQLPVEIQIIKLIEICKKYNVNFKEHNADYLSEDSLKWHPFLGIQAVNVAPEFGTTETRTILNLMKKNRFFNLYDDFSDLCIKSKKWEKWLVKDSTVSELEKVIISGHYLFSSEKGKIIINELRNKLKNKNIKLDQIIISEIKKNIRKYLTHFRLIK